MSYNTRRGGGYGTPSSAVGQRRMPASSNYQNQQQLNQQQQQAKPAVQQTPTRAQTALMQQQQQRNTQPQQQQVPKTPVQQQAQQKIQQPAAQQVQSTPAKMPQNAQEPKIVFKKDSSAERMEVTEGGGDQNVENGDGEGQLKKKFLFFRTGKGKISKKERLRKRNQRLRKILQPKNAPMVLNELVQSVAYNITEIQNGFNEENSFKASVVVDGTEHSGTGKSKALAKSNAAEAAIKHLVLKKVTSTISQQNVDTSVGEVEEGEKMEVVGEEDDGFSWSHVASFALHKLFNSWDDTNPECKMVANGMQTIIKDAMSGLSPSPGNLARLVANPNASLDHKPEHKPAKKMPDNAQEMNPIMLLNQMRPGTFYEEVGKAGAPPNLKFTFRCSVDGRSFMGTGASKKNARKHAAFAACQALLDIKYSQEILEGIAQMS